MLNGKVMTIHLMAVCTMTQYFHKPFDCLDKNVKFELDPSNYAKRLKRSYRC